MSKMTEGPWTVSSFDDEHGRTVYRLRADFYDNEHFHVAHFFGPDAEANCKAAAALPDLIEAAEPIVQVLCDLEERAHNAMQVRKSGGYVPTDDDAELIIDSDFIDISCGLARALRSALLKAKGGEG